MLIINRYNQKDGFSVAELLIAILILSMVSMVVAGGIPVARDAYNKITVSANKQVLLSTTVYALRSELGTATEIYNCDGNTIEYRSGKNGGRSRISIEEERIMIQEFIPDDSDDSSGTSGTGTGDNSDKLKRELSPEIEKDGLYVVCSSLDGDKSEGVITFTGVTVKKEGEAEDKSDDPTNVVIRTLAVQEDAAEGSVIPGSGSGGENPAVPDPGD